jgi:hypothetical protein
MTQEFRVVGHLALALLASDRARSAGLRSVDCVIIISRGEPK